MVTGLPQLSLRFFLVMQGGTSEASVLSSASCAQVPKHQKDREDGRPRRATETDLGYEDGQACLLPRRQRMANVLQKRVPSNTDKGQACCGDMPSSRHEVTVMLTRSSPNGNEIILRKGPALQ